MPEVIQAARAGRTSEAESLVRSLLLADPDHVDAIVATAMLAVARKKPGEARKALVRAMALAPDHSEAHLQSALLELNAGQKDAARASLRRAIDGRPPSAEAHFRLGEIEREQNHAQAAIDSFAKAVAIDPEHGEAHNNLGGLLRERGRNDEALSAFRRAVSARPKLALAWFNLGTLLRDRGQLAEAITALERSLQIEPRQADAHYWLGNAWMGSGDAARAAQAYRAALRIDANLLVARWGLTMAQIVPVPADEVQAAGSREAFSRELDQLAAWCRAHRPKEGFRAVGAQQPYYLAYQQQNNKELLQRYGRLCGDMMRPWEARVGLPAAPHVRGARCKVGIVSAHFHDHSVWNALVRAWVEQFDPAKIELHLFHIGGHQDAQTRIAQSRAKAFHGEPRDWTLWAKAISESHLDALVYPEVGMDSVTSKLAATHLAPTQIASWGHPETTGLASVGHFVSAAAMEPPNAAEAYSERLRLLPGLGSCSRRFGTLPARVDLARFGIAKGVRALVCAGMPFKYSPAHDSMWVEIAKRTAPSRLMFFRGQSDGLWQRLETRLRAAFVAAGLEFDAHVTFLPWQDQAMFFGVMKTADLYLDSPGFSGFNTTMQAIECGLPVVAFEGGFLRGRFASGILRELELQDCVASTADEYVAIVARLVADEPERKRLRAHIERRRDSLFGDVRSASSMQEFLLQATG